jgi:iron complex transport system ATP-binding protein
MAAIPLMLATDASPSPNARGKSCRTSVRQEQVGKEMVGNSSALRTEGVDFYYYENDGLVLRGVSLELGAGELVGLIGPNGSGKTTLLRVLSGLLVPNRGKIYLDGQDLCAFDRRQIAQRVAVVPQELTMPFAFSAYEMVMMGRTPHVRPILGAGPRDRQVVADKMELTATSALVERPFNELSGGEKQRVIIAMALAQEPDILLLDEPTVHLDINHQVEILELIKRLNRQENLTVLATMHDLNLAALYFDRLVLLDEGQVVANGSPAEVLREESIRQVFQAEVQVQEHPTRHTPQVVVLPLT